MMVDEGGNPMQMCMSMCKNMTDALKQTGEMAAFATPELNSQLPSYCRVHNSLTQSYA